MRDRDKTRALVNCGQHGLGRERHPVRRCNRHHLGPLLFQTVVDVVVGRKVQAIGDEPVAQTAPIEAGSHDPLADGNILLHHDFALAGTNDGTDQIADRNRHIPPALLPSADAAGRPSIGVFLHGVGRAPGHGTQRVADHVRGVGEDRKFLAPVE